MRFTNNKEAYEAMATNALAAGIFDEAGIRAYCQEIADSIPPSTKMAYAPEDLQEDVVVLAANYFETYSGKLAIDADGAGNSAVATQETGIVVKGGAAKKELPEPTLSDEQTETVKKLLSANLDKKQAMTAASRIKAILVRAPKPSEMFKGIELEVKDEKNMLPTYADVLVDTPENKAAYNKAVEAVKAGKKVKPYFNDASRKYMGVVVETLSAKAEGSAQKEERIFDNDMLVGFLTFEVLCRIPSVDDLGVELKGIKAVAAKGRKGESTKAAGIPNLSWDGRPAVIKAGAPDRVIAVSQVKKGEFRTGSLPTELAFQVYKVQRNEKQEITGYETNQKGEKLVKTIRLRGKSDKLPVLERIGKYVQIFGVEKNGTTIYANMSKSEQIEAIKTATDFISRMGENKDVLFSGYQDILNAVETAGNASTAQEYQA